MGAGVKCAFEGGEDLLSVNDDYTVVMEVVAGHPDTKVSVVLVENSLDVLGVSHEVREHQVDQHVDSTGSSLGIVDDFVDFSLPVGVLLDSGGEVIVWFVRVLEISGCQLKFSAVNQSVGSSDPSQLVNGLPRL